MRVGLLVVAWLFLALGPVAADEKKPADEPAKKPAAKAKPLTTEQAADAVLNAVNANDEEALKALAEKDEPDPWLVADLLCYRGEHDAAEAFALANRVAVFEEGRIVQTGTPAEIFESPATEFVASFTGAEFLLSGEIAETGDGTVMVRLDTGQRVEVQGSGDAGLRVKVAYRPEDVVVVPAESSSQQTSARNRYPARVAHLNPSGGLVRLRLEADGLQLEAMITRHALEELRLEVGSRVVAQIKATALHTFPI